MRNNEKNAALLIYPGFSGYEVGIAAAIFKMFGRKIDVFAAEKQLVDSEDGFHYMPDWTLDEFTAEKYDCLLLPGMCNFSEVLDDERIISFLRRFRDDTDTTIGSISSSPILLAKAGVLEGRRFCAGLFEEDIDRYSFVKRENLIRAPLVEDGNLITALGLAYREFGIAVARRLGMECGDDLFGGIKLPVRESDYIFRRSPSQ